MQLFQDLSGLKLSVYGSSHSHTATYQARSFPLMAVHAVIPRPIRLEAFRVRQFMQVIPRPIRREAFHVWQIMQLFQDISGLKVFMSGSSCNYLCFASFSLLFSFYSFVFPKAGVDYSTADCRRSKAAHCTAVLE